MLQGEVLIGKFGACRGLQPCEQSHGNRIPSEFFAEEKLHRTHVMLYAL